MAQSPGDDNHNDDANDSERRVVTVAQRLSESVRYLAVSVLSFCHGRISEASLTADQRRS
jgi:hypothetical protein